jgi:hypothetical protein
MLVPLHTLNKLEDWFILCCCRGIARVDCPGTHPVFARYIRILSTEYLSAPDTIRPQYISPIYPFHSS